MLSRHAVRALGALVFSMTGGLHLGCLIPPEPREVPIFQNFPPEIEIATLDPPEPYFVQNVDAQAGENCRFDLAATIMERDNCFVAFRLVADNRRASVQLLQFAETVRLGAPTANEDCPPPPYKKRLRFETETRDFSSTLSGEAHTISLFIKDSTDDWAVPNLDIGRDDTTLDAGALEPVPEGTRDGSVVSYNWTVVFNQMSCDPS